MWCETKKTCIINPMKKYLKLLRVKHYIKNLIIFLPMFFGGALLDSTDWKAAVIGFFAFCAASSAIYIINDIKDADKDRMHPTKKNRPIASGEISKSTAAVICAVCIVIAAGLSVITFGYSKASVILLLAYILINVLYSSGLKNVPVLDVFILASGYALRIYYGGFITGIRISEWLFLVITAGALYMGFGKRRGELLRGTDTRKVLEIYTAQFLERAMTVMLSLSIVFYALWAMDFRDKKMIFSVPVFIAVLIRYSMVSDEKADGDPVEIILSDIPLIVLSILLSLCIGLLIYI